MKQQLKVSHELWSSLSLQQQAEQRAKYDVTVDKPYACLDQLREMAKSAADAEASHG